MVDSIIQLPIVIEFILSVNLSALLAEPEHLLLDLHQFHDFAAYLILTHRTLLTHCRVKWRQDD